MYQTNLQSSIQAEISAPKRTLVVQYQTVSESWRSSFIYYSFKRHSMAITARNNGFFVPTENKMAFLVVFECKYPPVARLFMTEG